MSKSGTSNIQQARDDLAKWEAYVAADEATLRDYQQAAKFVRARLDVARRTAANLREMVQRWDYMHASTCGQSTQPQIGGPT